MCPHSSDMHDPHETISIEHFYQGLQRHFKDDSVIPVTRLTCIQWTIGELALDLFRSRCNRAAVACLDPDFR